MKRLVIMCNDGVKYLLPKSTTEETANEACRRLNYHKKDAREYWHVKDVDVLLDPTLANLGDAIPTDQLYDISTDYMKEKGCRIILGYYPVRNRHTRKQQPFIRIESEYGEPLMKASVNMVDESCGDGCTFIKDYGENAGILRELVRLGFVEETGRVVSAGHDAVDEVRILVPFS